MIYILHFDRRIAHARHYVGCCDEHRLKERLIEHARGRGAQLTKAAVKLKIPIYLARVLPELGFDKEKALKRNMVTKDYCPLCCPLLEALKNDCWKLDADRPEQPPPLAIWDWRTRDQAGAITP